MSDPRSFALVREFSAPRPRVYRVWTKPELVALWWGLEDVVNTVHAMEVRPGGSWRIDMRVATGTVYPNHGVFRTVIENELLEYSHIFPRPDDRTRLVEIWHRVAFADAGSGTRVEVTVTAPNAADCAMLLASGMRGGLDQGLDKLEHLLCEAADV